MEQNGTTTGYPVRYFQNQTEQPISQYVAYPPTSSYVFNQSTLSQSNLTQSIDPQSYDNSYNQALTDYAANQFYQKQYKGNNNSNKMQTSLKWNTKKKTPYAKSSNPNIFYCETCKISCAGEQTYDEHCKGQKHRKKELNLKNNQSSTTTTNSVNNQKSTYFCELCQVPCSGIDSYNAHLNGKSHIKVCNLQVKLGKEIPTDLISPIMKPTVSQYPPAITTPSVASIKNDTTIKVIGTPIINFIKGGSLKSMTSDSDAVEMKENGNQTSENSQIDNSISQQQTNNNKIDEASNDQSALALNDSVCKAQNNETIPTNEISNLINDSLTTNNQTSDEIPLLGDPVQPNVSISNQSIDLLSSNSEPVGIEYISEYSQPGSKATYYTCSLCNCNFSEIIAKEQHIRGKRHHKNYNSKNKPKVKKSSIKNPIIRPLKAKLRKAHSGPITICALKKNSNYQQFSQNSESTPSKKPPSFKDLLNNHQNESQSSNLSSFNSTATDSMNHEDSQQSLDNLNEQCEDDAELFEMNMDISLLDSSFADYSKYQSLDNRYLFKKHSEIVPREDDLKQYYMHISNIERSLKQVSDDLMKDKTVLKDIVENYSDDNERILLGEIRAGLFGKKLMLRDEHQIDLILFCSIKPTVNLLRKLIELLSIKLNLIENEKYELNENLGTASIDVSTKNLTLKITLTSLIIRALNVQSTSNVQQNENDLDPEGMLDKQKCLDALTALRRFKWYQAKVAPFNPCPMIIRLLRDLSKRIDVWKPLSCWVLELICERVMSNCLNRPTPAEAFKLILQTLASGVLINENDDDILIADPCEMEVTDALGYLTDQQRQEITDSANKLVQFIAFNKIYKVLDTETIKLDPNQNKSNDQKEN